MARRLLCFPHFHSVHLNTTAHYPGFHDLGDHRQHFTAHETTAGDVIFEEDDGAEAGIA